jgi:hypothetical protein
VQNFKTSKPTFQTAFILRSTLFWDVTASMDNWYPPFRDVVAYLHGSCTFRYFNMKALHRFETSGTNYPVTPSHITEQRQPTTPLRMPKNSQSFDVSGASGYVIRPIDSPTCERLGGSVFNSRQGPEFIYALPRTDRPWNPSSLLSNVSPGCLLGIKAVGDWTWSLAPM